MEALKHLVGAYFHQDWDLDGGESSDTVARFLSEPEELIRTAANEIDHLVAEDLDEGELQALLAGWGSAYRAGDTDGDYRRWLLQVRDQLRAAIDQ